MLLLYNMKNGKSLISCLFGYFNPNRQDIKQCPHCGETNNELAKSFLYNKNVEEEMLPQR